MEHLTPAQRLIVAADYKPSAKGDYKEVLSKVIALARVLSKTGVTIKVNSILRACGFDVIEDIRGFGLPVFADLKLSDISATLAIDGELLQRSRPEFVTVMCGAGVEAMKSLKAGLPETEVLGVTILTSLTEEECFDLYGCSVKQAVDRHVQWAQTAGIDGLVMAPAEARSMRDRGITMSINSPAIRPSWTIVPGCDQNPDRIMTPAKALEAGVDRVIIGRPIINDPNPYDAVMRTLDEIASVK
ncbi:MAG: orotidine 5'-phosphate decarboxylase / HUMPS family protein [bacterium]|nr:orotidine 5'-phosphate decarboxylase / HUMPS family protein [bacterium]